MKISSTIPSGFADAFEIVATDSLTFSVISTFGSFGNDNAGSLMTEDMVGITAFVFELVGLGKEKGLDVGVGAEVGFWKIEEVGFAVGVGEGKLGGYEVGAPLWGVGVGVGINGGDVGMGVAVGPPVGGAVGGTGVFVGATCPRRTSRGTGAVALPGIGHHPFHACAH